MIRLRPSGADEVLIKRVRDWYEPGPGVFIASTAGQTASFSPAQLFTGSTTGVWYDPSDMTTLFQDAAGTTPVTAVEQPVGLMLDKSKGLVLGPELVTNGADFVDSNSDGIPDGWNAGGSATISVVNEKLRVLQTTTTSAFAYQAIQCTFGRRYKCSFSFESVNGSTLAISVSTVVGNTDVYVATPGLVTNYTFTFVATATTTHYIQLQPWTSATNREAYFDNISVRELPGNHAFQSTSANRPTLSARYNLLTKTEDFSSDWTLLDASFTGFVTNPIGGSNARKVNFGATYGALRWTYLPFPPGVNGKYSLYVRKPTGSTATAIRLTTNNGSSWGTGMSQKFILTSQWTAISFTGIVQTGDNRAHILIGTPDVNGSSDADCVGEIEIWGADLRVANDALNQPAYQRVNTETDYDTVGFKPYLQFAGGSPSVNASMQTNSIDFSYGDKMFVCAGVRKLSDAAPGIVAELSANATSGNPGAFALTAPPNILGTFAFRSGGSTSGLAYIAGYAAPITEVLSGLGDISGDQAVLRINSTQAATDTADQGTGNYGNYPLYIGARAGSSLWFNGRLHQLVVAGKQASASEITSTETFINTKTGAF